MFPEDIQGINRVGLAIHQQVSGVKVDSQVARAYVFNKPQERNRRLLARLKPELNAFSLADLGDAFYCLHGAIIVFITGEFGDESQVGGNGGHTDGPGHARRVLHGRGTHTARGGRDQADGSRALDKVPDHAARRHCPQRDNSNAVLIGGRRELLSVLQGSFG